MNAMGYLKQEFWLNPSATLRSIKKEHLIILFVGNEPTASHS